MYVLEYEMHTGHKTKLAVATVEELVSTIIIVDRSNDVSGWFIWNDVRPSDIGISENSVTKYRRTIVS